MRVSVPDNLTRSSRSGTLKEQSAVCGAVLLTDPDIHGVDHNLSQGRSRADFVLHWRMIGVAFADEDSALAVKREWSHDATGPDLTAGYTRRTHIVDIWSPQAGEI
jgi:hypothetical protein